jgi:hypothetical protein
MGTNKLILGTFAAAALTVGAQQSALWRITEAPAELRPLVSRADVIIATMHDAVLNELTRGLAQGGPELAINACHLDATMITQRVARSEGIAAGRTSDRLRSPTNAPRPWAASLVKEYAGRRARDVDGFVVDLGDRVGVLRPIAERPMCANCHGPADRISPGVRAVLLDRYPADKALGFENNEIRGWFWVEIPKPQR